MVFLAPFAVQSGETEYIRRRQRDPFADNIKIQNWCHPAANQIGWCPGRRADLQLCGGFIEQRLTRLEITDVPR